MNLIYTTKLPSKENIYKFYEILEWNSFLKLSPEQLLEAMKNSWYSIYVYSGDNLVGTGRVISDGVINAYLCGLGVLPDFRCKGIGTEIVKKLTQQCESNNLHVQLCCEENLVQYYKEMGFEVFATAMKI